MKKFFPLIFIILTVFNSCQKDLSTSPEETLLSKNALFVESIPTGAKIFINDKNTGQYTPDTIYWLPEGNIKLTLKLEAFKDTSVIITINQADTQYIFVDYTHNPSFMGSVTCKSTPAGADLFVNDSSLNRKTPCIIKLFPGTYKITFKKSGCWDDYKTINVINSNTNYCYSILTDTSVWVNFTTTRTLIPTDYLVALAVAKNGDKWIGTVNYGLIKYDDTKWTVYNSSNSIFPDSRINYIYIDDSDVKWVCTDNGLIKIENDKWQIFNTSNSGIPEDRVTSVFNLGNEIAVGTRSRGISFYNGVSWTLMHQYNSILPSNWIKYIFHEKLSFKNFVIRNAEVTWFCTSEGILRRVTYRGDTTFQVLNQGNGLLSNPINCVVKDKEGKIWISYEGGNAWVGGTAIQKEKDYEKLYKTSWANFPDNPSRFVSSAVVDENNNKWFANELEGLSKVQWSEGIFFSTEYFQTHNSSIGSDKLYSVAIDENGHKWLASYGGGLIKFKGN